MQSLRVSPPPPVPRGSRHPQLHVLRVSFPVTSAIALHTHEVRHKVEALDHPLLLLLLGLEKLAVPAGGILLFIFFVEIGRGGGRVIMIRKRLRATIHSVAICLSCFINCISCFDLFCSFFYRFVTLWRVRWSLADISSNLRSGFGRIRMTFVCTTRDGRQELHLTRIWIPNISPPSTHDGGGGVNCRRKTGGAKTTAPSQRFV